MGNNMEEVNDNILSETRHHIRGYDFIKRTFQVKKKRSWKLEERWFALKTGKGVRIPEYVREGARRCGYKSFKGFFSQLAYYQESPESPKNLFDY
jgi:hypothetical protein